MIDFTFLTLSYNQEKYIERHLDSIKRIIIKYGKNLKVDFILADDKSEDKTVFIAKKWLRDNNIFFRANILEHSKNCGTVRNFLDGVNCIRTKDFKLLAADDYYVEKNIFSLYNDITGKMLITPLCLVGYVTDKTKKIFMENYSLLQHNASNYKMKKLLKRYSSVIPSPGVIFDGDFVRNKNFQNYLLQFNVIEDYPMWHYFVNEFNCDIKVLSNAFINYNVGNGISTNENHVKRVIFNSDLIKLSKIFRVKQNILPKYINPYCYLLWFERKFFYTVDTLKSIIKKFKMVL